MTLAALAPVALADVVATADLQTRRDRKYLVPAATVDDLLDGISARVLQIDGRRRFRYESIYFDTPAWDSYLAAARRRPHRFKVRTRTYLDSGECQLEVKVRNGRGATVKHRRLHDGTVRDLLTDGGRSFVAQFVGPGVVCARLRPVLQVTYHRSTLVLGDRHTRATVDDTVTWAEPGEHTGRVLCDYSVIETKTPGPPGELDRRLWRAGHRPVKVSKYATGLALAHPDLPANKWHRTLTRVVPSIRVGVGLPVPLVGGVPAADPAPPISTPDDRRRP